MTVLRSICFLQPLLTLGCLCTVFWPLSLLSRSPTWGKAKPLLGHNLWASCTTSPVLLLPLWTYTYLSLLPECLLPASWPDQVCSCSRALAHRGLLAWKALAPVVVWCLILRYLQVSQGTDFPQLLSPIIKAICPLLPWQPSVCSPCLIFPQSASSRGVAGSHSLLGDEGLQESESCAVCCCTPGLGRACIR